VKKSQSMAIHRPLKKMMNGMGSGIIIDPPPEPRRKIVYAGGAVEIAADLVYELDADGNQLRVVQYTDFTGQRVRTLYPDADTLRAQWADPGRRQAIVDLLAERGIDFDDLARAVNRHRS